VFEYQQAIGEILAVRVVETGNGKQAYVLGRFTNQSDNGVSTYCELFGYEQFDEFSMNQMLLAPGDYGLFVYSFEIDEE